MPGRARRSLVTYGGYIEVAGSIAIWRMSVSTDRQLDDTRPKFQADSTSSPRVKVSAFSDAAFRWLWLATMSAQGASATAAVVVPILAIQVLGVGPGGVTVMSTAAACLAVVTAIPAGMFAEFRRKRPILVGSDAVRFLSFALLAVAALFGLLSLPWLVLVLCINAVTQMLFGSASLAHTKDLVPEELRADAVGKLQSASWVAMIAGPIVGGALVAVAPNAVLLASVSLCFLGSAVCISFIRKPEGPAAQRDERKRPLREAFAGVAFFAGDRTLRRLLISWVLFAGAVAALTPVTQVFFLHDLEFSPAEFGLAMGIPSIAALAGAWVGGPILRKVGVGRAIVIGSLARVPLYWVYPVLPAGLVGLGGAILAFSGILFASSIVNTAISTLRMDMTPRSLLSRTSSAWMVATMVSGPLFIPLAGLIMTNASSRTALLYIALTVAISAFVLPTKTLNQAP